MPSFTLNATADGTNGGWALGAGPTKWQAVSDASDATYISQNPAVSRQSFVTENLPADAESVASPVVVNVRGDDVTATVDLCYSHFRYSGANYEDATGWNFSTTTADYTRNWANAPGGAAWTPTNLNACEMGVARLVATNYTMIVYREYLTGTYYQQGATFISIWSVVLPLLGAGIGLSHMRGIARAMRRLRQPDGGARVAFLPEEYPEALRALRAWRRPAFAF